MSLSAHRESDGSKQPDSLLHEIGRWFQKQIRQFIQVLTPYWKFVLSGIIFQFTIFIFYGLVWINFFPTPDYNDWAELVYLGVINIGLGINPYGRTYTLGIALDTPRNFYDLHAYHYGPLSLISHLPMLLFPYRYDGIGWADFMPALVILQILFTFIIFYQFLKIGHPWVGVLFWANPLFVPMEYGTFFAFTLLLITLGLVHIDNAKLSMLWFGLATVAYQLAVPLLFFALLYHVKKVKELIWGLLPAVLIFCVFSLWSALEGQPLQLISDLIISQMNRPYMDVNIIRSVPAIYLLMSVPSLLHFLFGFDPISLWTGGFIRMTTIMMLITLIMVIVFTIKFLYEPSIRRLLLYSTIIILLFILSMPWGLIQYYVLLVIPFIFYLFHTSRWNGVIQYTDGILDRSKSKQKPPQ